jgi:hypothetical protein
LYTNVVENSYPVMAGSGLNPQIADMAGYLKLIANQL